MKYKSVANKTTTDYQAYNIYHLNYQGIKAIIQISLTNNSLLSSSFCVKLRTQKTGYLPLNKQKHVTALYLREIAHIRFIYTQ